MSDPVPVWMLLALLWSAVGYLAFVANYRTICELPNWKTVIVMAVSGPIVWLLALEQAVSMWIDSKGDRR